MSFDQYAILLTEEIGRDANPLTSTGPESHRALGRFSSAIPTDRSSQLSEFLQKFMNEAPARKIAELSSGTKPRRSGRNLTEIRARSRRVLGDHLRETRAADLLGPSELHHAGTVRGLHAGVYRMHLESHEDIAYVEKIDFCAIQSHGKRSISGRSVRSTESVS